MITILLYIAGILYICPEVNCYDAIPARRQRWKAFIFYLVTSFEGYMTLPSGHDACGPPKPCDGCCKIYKVEPVDKIFTPLDPNLTDAQAAFVLFLIT